MGLCNWPEIIQDLKVQGFLQNPKLLSQRPNSYATKEVSRDRKKDFAAAQLRKICSA